MKAGPSRSTAALGTIPKPGWPRTAGKLENGWSSRTTTVAGSGVSTPARPVAVPAVWKAAKPVTPSSWATNGESEPFRAIRSKVNLTSVDVTGLPSSKRAPGGRWNVKAVWAGSASNERASPGAGWSSPASRTSVSKSWSTTITAFGSRASAGSRLGRPTTPTWSTPPTDPAADVFRLDRTAATTARAAPAARTTTRTMPRTG